MTYGALLRWAQRQLASKVTPQLAQQEAQWLLTHVTGLSVAATLLSEQDACPPSVVAAYEALIDQRLIHDKPLAYLLGTVPFCSLSIAIEPPMLIPRPETEELTMAVIALIKKSGAALHILDLCTGSGCIALALAAELSACSVVGSDSNPEAIALAEKNKKLLNISNVSFVQGDLFEAVQGEQFDLIISNPPYLATCEWETLDTDVRLWEDRNALIAGTTGFELYERIFANAPLFLTKTAADAALPRLVIEHGHTQQKELSTLATTYGFNRAQSFVDAYKKDRGLFLYER